VRAGGDNMSPERITVLVVEDNADDVLLLEKLLVRLGQIQFTLVPAERLTEALVRVAEHNIDVVLLDLALPDGQGMATVARMHAAAPDLPIVVLTGLEDESLAVQIVQAGAQDYLVKGQITAPVLGRALRYAIERQRLLSEIRNLSLTDELTGLYNRRGFLTLAVQQLKFAQRLEQGLLLVFVDVDGLKQINDLFGYEEGDRALRDAAAVLRSTFRGSDIVARFGGDEFMILALQPRETHAGPLLDRLQAAQQAYNTAQPRRYPLALSAGVVYFAADNLGAIDTLMGQADEALREHKRNKRRGLPLRSVGTTTGGPGRGSTHA